MLRGRVPSLVKMYFTDSPRQCGADSHSLNCLPLLHMRFPGSAKDRSNKEQTHLCKKCLHPPVLSDVILYPCKNFCVTIYPNKK